MNKFKFSKTVKDTWLKISGYANILKGHPMIYQTLLSVKI